MTGTLSLGSIEQFQAAVGNEQRAVIIMEGPGGNLSAGIEIGTRIRLRGYRTVVDQFATCSSACALAWLGGTSRHLDTKSRVGFHAAYEDDSGKSLNRGWLTLGLAPTLTDWGYLMKAWFLSRPPSPQA